jgi:hypothetical protein
VPGFPKLLPGRVGPDMQLSVSESLALPLREITAECALKTDHDLGVFTHCPVMFPERTRSGNRHPSVDTCVQVR